MFDSVNLIAIMFSVGTLIMSVLIYRKIRYKPLFLFVFQGVVGVILRVLIDIEAADRGTVQNWILVTVFYASMFLASISLYRTISKYGRRL